MALPLSEPEQCKETAMPIDVVFATTPGISVWQHPLAPAMLTALLQENGYTIAQIDGHIAGVEDVLRRANPEQIDCALKILRDPALDIHREEDLVWLHWARKCIERTSQGIPPVGYFEVANNHVRYSIPGCDYSFGWLFEAIKKRRENLFYEYMSEKMLPQIVELKPRVVGITIGHDTQLVSSLILGSMVKEALPEAKVVYGGNYLAQVQSVFEQPEFAKMFEYGDCYVYAEGFHPSLEIMQSLTRKEDFRSVTGAVWRSEEGVVRNIKTNHPFDFENIPTPIFEGMEQQWSPEPIYPLYTMSNCPYACNFCAIPAGSDTYMCPPRMMTPRRVAEHVAKLVDQGARLFTIADESMPVRRLHAIGQELEKMNYGGRALFSCLMNAEECLSDKKVCRELYSLGLRCAQIGIETISVSSLESQNKRPNKPALYRKMIKTLSSAGIQVHLFLIVGLPGEAVADSLATLAFLEECGDDIATAVVSRFRVPKMSRAGLTGAGTQGIVVKPDTKPWSANLDFEYVDGKSGQQVDALRKIGRQVCIDLPLHQITSLLAEHANRLRWPLDELKTAAKAARRYLPREDNQHNIERETAKITNAVGLPHAGLYTLLDWARRRNP